MSYLARFETFMERLVETSLRRLMNKPIEQRLLMRRLERVMEANQVIAGIHTLVPHTYYIYLSPHDFSNSSVRIKSIETETAHYLSQLARSRNFITTQPIVVVVAQKDTIAARDFMIAAESIESSNVHKTTADMQAIAAGDALRPTYVSDTNTSMNLGNQRNARYQIVVTSADEIFHCPITVTQISLGRAPGNHVILNDHQVSRHHARITFNARRFQITDLASRNGTFVNGTQLDSQPYTLDIEHDVITISHYTIRIKPHP